VQTESSLTVPNGCQEVDRACSRLFYYNKQLSLLDRIPASVSKNSLKSLIQHLLEQPSKDIDSYVSEIETLKRLNGELIDERDSLCENVMNLREKLSQAETKKSHLSWSGSALIIGFVIGCFYLHTSNGRFLWEPVVPKGMDVPALNNHHTSEKGGQ